MMIREFDRDDDIDGVRACLIELQDFERRIDSRMPAGDEIADEYFEEMLSRCEECAGTIFVVAEGKEVAGYVSVLTRVRSGALDDGDLEYGLVADLICEPNTMRGL